MRRYQQFNLLDDADRWPHDRLWRYIDATTSAHGCWLWTAPIYYHQATRFMSIGVRMGDGRHSSRSPGRLLFQEHYHTPLPANVRLGPCPHDARCVHPAHLPRHSRKPDRTTVDYDVNIICVHGHLRAEHGRRYRGAWYCRACRKARNKPRAPKTSWQEKAIHYYVGT